MLDQIGRVCWTVSSQKAWTRPNQRPVASYRKHMDPVFHTHVFQLPLRVCVYQSVCLLCNVCVCLSFFLLCLVYASTRQSALTLSALRLPLLPRPLEFPGLLCDFRGVERRRAGPRVAEWVTAIISPCQCVRGQHTLPVTPCTLHIVNLLHPQQHQPSTK